MDHSASIRLRHRRATRDDGSIITPIETTFTTYKRDRWATDFFDKGYSAVIFSENGKDIGFASWRPLPEWIGLAYLIFVPEIRRDGRGTEAYTILRETYWGHEVLVVADPGEQNPGGLKFFREMQKFDKRLKIGNEAQQIHAPSP